VRKYIKDKTRKKIEQHWILCYNFCVVQPIPGNGRRCLYWNTL